MEFRAHPAAGSPRTIHHHGDAVALSWRLRFSTTQHAPYSVKMRSGPMRNERRFVPQGRCLTTDNSKKNLRMKSLKPRGMHDRMPRAESARSGRQPECLAHLKQAENQGIQSRNFHHKKSFRSAHTFVLAPQNDCLILRHEIHRALPQSCHFTRLLPLNVTRSAER